MTYGPSTTFKTLSKYITCDVALGAYPYLQQNLYTQDCTIKAPVTYGYNAAFTPWCAETGPQYSTCGNCPHYHGWGSGETSTRAISKITQVKGNSSVPLLGDYWKSFALANKSMQTGILDYSCGRTGTTGSCGNQIPFGVNASVLKRIRFL